METFIEGGIVKEKISIPSATKEKVLELIDDGRLAPSTISILQTKQGHVALYYEDWYEECQEKFSIMSEESINDFIKKFNSNIKNTIQKLLEKNGFQTISVQTFHIKGYADFGRSLIIVKMK
jgi:hypothetical protein